MGAKGRDASPLIVTEMVNPSEQLRCVGDPAVYADDDVPGGGLSPAKGPAAASLSERGPR